ISAPFPSSRREAVIPGRPPSLGRDLGPASRSLPSPLRSLGSPRGARPIGDRSNPTPAPVGVPLARPATRMNSVATDPPTPPFRMSDLSDPSDPSDGRVPHKMAASDESRRYPPKGVFIKSEEPRGVLHLPKPFAAPAAFIG